MPLPLFVLLLVVFALTGSVTGLPERVGTLGEVVASCVAGMDDVVDVDDVAVSLGVVDVEGVEAMLELLEDEGVVVLDEGVMVLAEVEGEVVELVSVLLRSQPAIEPAARAKAATIGISFFMGFSR